MQLSKYLYDFHIFFVDNVLNSKISPLCVCAAIFQWTCPLQIGFLAFKRASVQHL